MLINLADKVEQLVKNLNDHTCVTSRFKGIFRRMS